MSAPSKATTITVFAAFDRWKEVDDLALLSEFDRTLILVWSMLGIIPGEGSVDFYDTSTGKYFDENVASLRRIGAHKAAELIATANESCRQWDEEEAARVATQWSRFEATGSLEPLDPTFLEELYRGLEPLETEFTALVDDAFALLDRFVSADRTTSP